MVTLDYEEKNQNEKSENSDSISRCQFENASLLNDAWQLSLDLNVAIEAENLLNKKNFPSLCDRITVEQYV